MNDSYICECTCEQMSSLGISPRVIACADHGSCVGMVSAAFICVCLFFHTISEKPMHGITKFHMSVSVDVYRPRLRSIMTTATWSCSAPSLTDSVGAVFLCPGRTCGTSCHLTFGKCPIDQNNLLEHWKLFYFETALTSSSEDNIKRRAMAKTSTSTS